MAQAHEPKTWEGGERRTSSKLNREIRDNMRATAPQQIEEEGDLVTGSGPMELDRIPLGPTGEPLIAGDDRPVYGKLDHRGLAEGYDSRIFISTEEPGENDGRDGDIWIIL